jgi:ribosomal protein S14
MIKTIRKDKKNGFAIYKTEIKKTLIKSVTENWNFCNMVRWNASIKLYYFLSSSFKTRLVFKCILKGSKKGINKIYHYSRQTFLKLIRFGTLSGLKKASW